MSYYQKKSNNILVPIFKFIARLIIDLWIFVYFLICQTYHAFIDTLPFI